MAVSQIHVRPDVILVGGGDRRGRPGPSSSLDSEETDEGPGNTESSHTAEDTDQDQGGVAATGDPIDDIPKLQTIH